MALETFNKSAIENCSIVTCNDSKLVLGNPLSIGGRYLDCVLGVVGVSLNILLVIALVSMRSTHRNIRILMCNTSITGIVCAANAVIKDIRMLSFNLSDPTFCNVFPVTKLQCKAEDLLIGTTYVSIAAAMAFVAIERFVATHHHDTYHERSSNLGWYLTTGSWALGLAIHLFGFTNGNEGTMAICHLTFCATMEPVIFYIGTVVVLNAALIPVYYNLVSRNRKKLDDFLVRQLHLSLAGRLELRHNIGIAEALIPTVIVHSVVSIVTSALQFVILWFGSKGMKNTACPLSAEYLIYLAPIDCMISCQAILYPLIIFWKHEAITKKAWELVINIFPVTRRYFLNKIEPIKGFAKQRIAHESMTAHDHVKRLLDSWVVKPQSNKYLRLLS